MASEADQTDSPSMAVTKSSPVHAEPQLVVQDVKVHFPIRRGFLFDRTVGYVKAVDGISFEVQKGSTFGLVGESGCGKSTIGRAILRLVEPTAGTIEFEGRNICDLDQSAMRDQRRSMQMIFQDPMASLDPRQSVGSILREPMRAHKMPGGPREWDARVSVLLDQVGLPSSVSTRYPHEFSGGQRQRIGIARALATNPALIIADEPVSALDVSVQAQVVNLLADLRAALGLTYVVIAHDLAVVQHISDEVGVMYLGVLVERAPADELYKRPLHPYTKALLSAVPIPDPVVEDRRAPLLLQGDLPSPSNPPSGCRFSTRCPYVSVERCKTERPDYVEYEPGHWVACHFVGEIERGERVPANAAESMVASKTQTGD